MAKSGDLFPETTGFMIAIQNQVICKSIYMQYILNDPNTTKDISRKCREKLKTIQNITDVYSARALGDCIHRRNEDPSRTDYHMWTVKGITNSK